MNDFRNRRSTTGFAFTLADGAVSSATSPTEANVLVAVSAAKHTKYLHAALHKLGFSQRVLTPIFEIKNCAIEFKHNSSGFSLQNQELGLLFK